MSETVQTCFCLEEIARSKRNLCQLREQLPKVRNQYDQYRGTGLNRERDTLVELQSIVKRLWDEFPLLIQQLNEYGDAELIQITGKLYKTLKRYDYLGAKSYAPLCRALEAFEGMMPCETRIDAAALGHLMNRVRMGSALRR